MKVFFEIPNLLTCIRIIIAPLIAVFIINKNSIEDSLLIFILFLIAALSDWLDGYLARKMGKMTNIGKMLDPIADKLLVITCFFSLSIVEELNVFFHFPILAIIFREVLVSGIREFLGQINQVLNVSKLGKWKTATQMTAIGIFLFQDLVYLETIYFIGIVILWIALIITILSGLDYFISSIKTLNNNSMN